jgi:hypothetical protein
MRTPRLYVHYNDDYTPVFASSAEAYADIRKTALAAGKSVPGKLFSHDEQNVSYVYLSSAEMLADTTRGDHAFCVVIIAH